MRAIEMYPSGTWRGYWDEVGLGRQSMSDLVLQFGDGLIEGEGIDIVGRFQFAGNYADDGTVTLVKYYRRHDVLYQGAYDGEGTIFGQWTIDEFWRGRFALTPERRAIAAGTEIQEIVPTPNGD
jgi:hypothetical protein